MSKLTDKVIKGETLNEEEIRKLLWWDEDAIQVDETEGESHRWTRDVQTILQINGEFWAVDWNKGLTEYQENEFPYQPYRVKKQEHQMVITEWVELEVDK